MKRIFYSLFLLVFLQTAHAQSGIQLSLFSNGYDYPLGLENCGDSRLFVVQKGGRIVICDSLGGKRETPFLDISDRVNQTLPETGLLGLAFDPKYATNGFFYVYYITKQNNSSVSRFKVKKTDPNVANPASEKVLLTIPQTYPNHVGGCLRFGPDGFLYIGLGDGDAAGSGDPLNYAQNPSLLQGKMLRIKPKIDGTYAIPASNPFKDSANYRKEIWAIGLRNPWRFSFDPVTGALFIGDVGEGSWEEVDLQKAGSKGGENYGWRCYESNYEVNTSGCKPKAKYKFPVYEYPHSTNYGDCAITGGFIYRGKKYPDLYGKYFFTDFCSGVIRSLTFKGTTVTGVKEELKSGLMYTLTSFGEDYKHELYVVNSAGGSVHKIVSAAALTSGADNLVAALTIYPNPAPQRFSVKYTTAKAEACLLAVYAGNGRKIYADKKTSLAGDNTWTVILPSYVKGNCYVIISSMSGTVIRRNVLIK